MVTFRIDDVSVNTDMEKLWVMITLIKEKHPDARIIYGVSLIVCDGVGERVFHKIWNARSDFRKFFELDSLGIPKNIPKGELASHGLIHVDHRFLDRQAQEMSIITSSSILYSDLFIPPFNKWNKITEEICKEYNIELIKFEDGWNHLKCERHSEKDLFYFHTHDFTLEEFKSRIP